MLVLVLDCDETLHARLATPMQQLRARLASTRLDRQLAGGQAPESSLLLAIRAQQLVRDRMRHELANSLQQLADEATGSAPHPADRVPMDWAAVRAVAADLRTLAARLLAFEPTPARGVARVSVLLGDGAGPLYSPHSLAELRSAVSVAVDDLDPMKGT